MKAFLSRSIIYTLAMFLLACSSMGDKKPSSEDVSFVPKSLSASGAGVMPDDASLTTAQRRLAAEQVAKMNAYRALASLLYREKLAGEMTVGGQVIKDENYRVYFDTFLREAEVIDKQSLGSSLYTTLTLAVTDRFYQCMSGRVEIVRQCMQQDNKMLFTRLGYGNAELKTVNLACGTVDCADMLHVQGFARQKNAFDRTLLNAGLYDSEWTVNTAGRLLINFFLLNSIPDL